MQKRTDILTNIASIIAKQKSHRPILVGIDGIDGAGKTTLAKELTELIGKPVVNASIDGFHNTRETRYKKGHLSPEGYYEDSFNYDVLKETLLQPLHDMNGKDIECRTDNFDFKADEKTDKKPVLFSKNTILLFEGVFLFRPEINNFWDFRIFIDIDFSTSLERGLKRDLELFGDIESTREKYEKRYIAGQKIYLKNVKPAKLADIVIKNDELEKPVLIEN